MAISDEAAPVDPDRVAAVAKEHFGLPPGAVAVPGARVPRLPNGKPDYRAVAALAGGSITKVCREAVPSHGDLAVGGDSSPAAL